MRPLLGWSAVITILLRGATASAQTPQGTAFTYQGRLQDGGGPASGAYDLRFVLYDAATGGAAAGPTLTRDDVPVADGLFTVSLDFAAAFAGSQRWLEVAVRPGASTGAFTTLMPRQELTPAPGALYSATAPWAGVSGKPAGFADGVDDDALGALSCAAGQVPKWNSIWACAADANSGGTVTSVVAGEGLTGGTITGSGTLAVSFAGSGAAAAAARSDHHHDGTYADAAHQHHGAAWTGSASPGLSVSTTGANALLGSTTSSAGLGVRGDATAASGLTYGVYGQSSSTGGRGVSGAATATTGTSYGVLGRAVSTSGSGVAGFADAATGLTIGSYGRSASTGGIGVWGEATATSGVVAGVFGLTPSTQGTGVWGTASAVTGATSGVLGRAESTAGTGVSGMAVATTGATVGVEGVASSPDGVGVSGRNLATSGPALGVRGLTSSSLGTGVYGEAGGGTGVRGRTTGGGQGVGVHGEATHATATNLAVLAENRSSRGYGVLSRITYLGDDSEGTALAGIVDSTSAESTAVAGFARLTPGGGGSYAGMFSGRVLVNGPLTKASGSFKIDHPLDPENKYLYHSFVESPDMLNVYNGNVTTDERGYATVVLPDWFEALNKDFRYQLTVLDAAETESWVFAKVVRKVEANRFTLRTSAPHVEVSWQVTGIRRDRYAEMHRIPVEEAKPERERGTYLHPEAWGQPTDRGLDERRRPRLPSAPTEQTP